MKINTPNGPIFTHGGAPAKRINPVQQLRRTVMSCLLWENEFYESGKNIADRIREDAAAVDTETLASIAHEARMVHGLRHAPLLLLLELVKRGGEGTGDVIAANMKRADDMTELVALYWKFNPGKPLSAQMKRGLAKAFGKFNEYQLAKYDRDGQVLLRDILRLVRPKPDDEHHSALYDRVNNRTMKAPDTWEVALSSGANKKETFERLIREDKLGYLALLRNLRNIERAECDFDLVNNAILARKGANLIFPFRYTAAARAAPRFERALDAALIASVADGYRFPGRTAVLIDVSGSMDAPLSTKSDLTRLDAAATLGSVINGDLRLFTFSDRVVEVPARMGMAGVDAIIRSQLHGSTRLGEAIQQMNRLGQYDRLIVITDEQTHSRVPDPVVKHAYMINVASSRNGVGYYRWTHIDGFSEAVIRYMAELELARDAWRRGLVSG